jgi:hypothetical protein
MTKKQLEARVAALEKQINELQSQILTLTLGQPSRFVEPAPGVQPLTTPKPYTPSPTIT